MRTHYTPEYLLNPAHQVTIDLVGMGGSGSQVLSGLARINEALTGLGHPGIHVRSWDSDIVTQANLGRQMFAGSDLGQNKAQVLVTRVNRFFGYEWESQPMIYAGNVKSNILITCVDSAKARVKILDRLLKSKKSSEPVDKLYYWLDLGNLQTTGQCVLGTFTQGRIPKEDKKAKRTLKNVVQVFPQLRKMKGTDSGPSCSLAEALEKQDLFINSTLAQFGCNLIWKLLREGKIRYHGAYINLETLSVNPIKIN